MIIGTNIKEKKGLVKEIQVKNTGKDCNKNSFTKAPHSGNEFVKKFCAPLLSQNSGSALVNT